ncbi:hypothetical protein ACHAQH_007115, partial [Verticillium albo-atrum]
MYRGAAIAELESDESPSPMKNAVAEVTCLVSIGTGRHTFEYNKKGKIFNLTKAVPDGLISMKDAAQMCIKIATECRKQHLSVRSRFEKADRSDAYYRFDVDKGLEKVKLDESDEKALKHISAVTKTYLKDQAAPLKRCAQLISPGRST